jgi:hypothetical protein
MYKKVTHEIVEEHFHQRPMLAEGQVQPGQELPLAVMNEATLVFRMDSRSLWAKYAWNLLNYSISMNSGLPGTPQVEARLMRAAHAISDFIVPYYGIAAGNDLKEKLASIAKVGTEVVDAVKDKRSTDQFMDIWENLIKDLAVFLNQLNPGQWPTALIQELFTELVRTWTKAIETRYAEEWIDNNDALDSLEKLVVTGIPDHVNQGFSSIADVVSRGIIAQYPSLFVK